MSDIATTNLINYTKEMEIVFVENQSFADYLIKATSELIPNINDVNVQIYVPKIKNVYVQTSIPNNNNVNVQMSIPNINNVSTFKCRFLTLTMSMFKCLFLPPSDLHIQGHVQFLKKILVE